MADLSASEIFNKRGEQKDQDSITSFSNEINLLDHNNNRDYTRQQISHTNNTNFHNNTNNKSDNSSIGGGKILDKKDR
jgi:hypothetical protein